MRCILKRIYKLFLEKKEKLRRWKPSKKKVEESDLVTGCGRK